MLQNVTSAQDLHCFPLDHNFLDTSPWSQMKYKFQEKYGLEFRCPNLELKRNIKYGFSFSPCHVE